VKAVVQRVTSASVEVETEVVGSIDDGLLILLGVETGDDDTRADALARKISKLRVFRSDSKPMDRSLLDLGYAALVVSQFTLCANTQKGNRPSFLQAAEPGEAERLYVRFCESLRAAGVPVETGRFRAMMDVRLNNDGPVTLILES
jgi:D-tyrosyl-tRNA(Tyr) deacylase